MSPTHFNPETLCSTRHVKSAETRFCCRKLERATADNLEYMTPTFLSLTPSAPPTLHTRPRGLAQLRTLLHAKRTGPRARNTTHMAVRWERARTSVADNSHPVIFDCSPLMLGQRHLTHSSVGLGPPVPHCRQPQAARELLQLCRTNTEICLPRTTEGGKLS